MKQEIDLQMESTDKPQEKISKKDIVEMGIVFLVVLGAIVLMTVVETHLFPTSRGFDPLTTSRIGGFR